MNSIRRIDAYIIAVLLALMLLAHAILPRYRSMGSLRVLDTWTGRVCYNGCAKKKVARRKPDVPRTPVSDSEFERLWKATSSQ